MANTLNTVSSGGIEDGSIVNADINASAAIALSKLASTPAVLTGSTNNQITTVTGANAITGEANLTFDGSVLTTTQANSAIGAVVKNTTHDSQLQILAEAADKNSTIFFGDAADDDIGIIDYDHNNNSLAFTTNTSERLRIDSAGRVGIGDTSPTSLLTVGANANIRTANPTVLVSPASGDAQLQLRGGNPTIDFDCSGGGIGRILTDAKDFAFSNGTIDGFGTENARIQNTGGISFNGDTAAANALDDYEEGTFTPTYGGSSDPTCSYDAQLGVYTKIGRLVTVHLRLRTDSVSGGSGSLKIEGLPFSAPNDPVFGAYITFTNHWKADSAPTLVHLGGNDDYFYLYNKADGNEDASVMTTGDLNTGADDNDIRLTATYVV